MNFIIGSAPEINCEIDEDQVSGTTLTLESLIDPDGNELANSETLDFGSGDDSNIGSVVWQSEEGVNPIGKYTFIIKAVNGAVENFAKGSFYLEERNP